jgi:predicted nucleic acid-binding protein
MLYLDTCVLLALLTPEVHSPAASAFLEQAAETLAISPWSAHRAAFAIAAGRGATLCSLDAPLVQAAQQLGLDAQLIGSD